MRHIGMIMAVLALACFSAPLFAQDAPAADKPAKAGEKADANKDGKVTFEELKAVRPELTQEKFKKMDHDGDGVLTKADRQAKPDGGAVKGDAQHKPGALREKIAQADTNKDGKVTREEAKAGMPKMTDEQFAKLDTNKDGAISKEDRPAGAAAPTAAGVSPEARKKAAMRITEADANKDGKVSLEEAKAKFPKMTDERFKKMDRNGDGFVSRDDRKKDQ